MKEQSRRQWEQIKIKGAGARKKEDSWICSHSLVRGSLPDLSCLMRPLLVVVLTGRKSLNQEMSGSGLPLAAQSMVAVRVRSTTFSCGPMSMVGKPGGSWSSGDRWRRIGVSEIRYLL